MPFFKRGKKPGQDVDPNNNGPVPPEKPAADVEGEEGKNEISLARTKTEDIVYPTGIRLALLMTSVFISSTYLSVER